MKVIDTTVAVDHLRGSLGAELLLARLLHEGETIAASEVVRFELLAGVREDEMQALEEFFSAFTWIAVDEGIARTAGLLAREHRGAHSGIDDVDYLIAATVLILEAELLTTNVRHFPMLPGFAPPY